jgi:hypothetical protein
MEKFINSYMKNFQELLLETNNFLSEKTKKENIINDIVVVLELTEQYLGRKLSTSEIKEYTNVLLEEEDKKPESKQQFKKGKYTIEITTSDGKLVKSATSQQGILNVIHGERQYRVLDGNNRDITAKLKAFIKEKQKQQELKKKYAKRKKAKAATNESVESSNISLNEIAGITPILKMAAKKIGAPAFKASMDFLGDVASDIAMPAINAVRGGGRSSSAPAISAVRGGVAAAKDELPGFAEPERGVRAIGSVLDSGPTPPPTAAAQTLDTPTASSIKPTQTKSAWASQADSGPTTVRYREPVPSSMDTTIPTDVISTPKISVKITPRNNFLKTALVLAPIAASTMMDTSTSLDSGTITDTAIDTATKTATKTATNSAPDSTTNPATDSATNSATNTATSTATDVNITPPTNPPPTSTRRGDDSGDEEEEEFFTRRGSYEPKQIVGISSTEDPKELSKTRRTGLYGVPTNY